MFRRLVFLLALCGSCGANPRYSRLFIDQGATGGIGSNVLDGSTGTGGSVLDGGFPVPGTGGRTAGQSGGNPSEGDGGVAASGGSGGRANSGGSNAGADASAGGAGATRGGSGGSDGGAPGAGGGAGRASGSGGSNPIATGGAGSMGRAGMPGAGTGGSGQGGATPLILSIDFVGAIPASTTRDGGAGDAGTAVADGGTVRPSLIPVPMAATEVAGVKAVANWNSASASSGLLSTLELSDGTVTTATVEWSVPPTSGSTGVYGVGLVDAPGDARMLNGYLDSTSPTAGASVIVNNLPPEIANRPYDVYVYTLNHLASGTLTSKYTLGGMTISVTQTGPSPETLPPWSTLPPNATSGAANYLVFRSLRGASFTLTATPAGTVPRAPVNGIQIVSPSGS